MRTPRIALLALVIASVAFAAPVAAGGNGFVTDGAAKPVADVDTSLALVQLNGEPLSTYVKTKPVHGKKIDFGNTSVKSYRAQLSAFRNDFKQWLQANAPKAKIVRSWDLSLNAVSVQLNGTTLAKLATAPQVTHVEYSGLYHPTLDDPDLSLINAEAGWSAVGGAANAGAGVKIAIVDTGIDVTHPCFDDTGYAAQTQLGDTSLTNNKVIAAKVFNMKTPSRHFTPEAIQDHGTHVAGTAACNFQTPMTIGGVDIPYDMSGVAPAALLGNYNVFPGDVDNAHSEDIIDALEAAYTDGFDVANMSLGGRHQGISDLLTQAVDDLDQANMVIAVAAGNSGAGNDAGDHPAFPPGHYTIESPGSAARALTAGAFAVGHAIASQFSIGGSSYFAQGGAFPLVSANLTAPTAILTDAPVNAASGFSEACDTLPAGSLTGQIAMIGRGTCDFSFKIRTAELAGAIAVIVVNRLPGDPIPMGTGASPDGVQPTIPAYMISLEAGIAIRTADPTLNGASGTIGLPEYVVTDNDYVQADFSSQGPTDVDFRVKPDVMAPGQNVISSIPESQCDHALDDHCFAFFSGTSMATPHLAGSAAVVRGAHPDWSAEQVRSAIVNTAAMGDVTSFADGSVVTDANITGAGRVDLGAAVDASVAIGPVSTSFGAVPAGAGQSLTAWVTITNLTAGPQTWSLAVTDVQGSGVGFSLGASSVTLAAGESTTVAVTMTASKGAGAGDHQALLNVNSATETLAHSVLYTFVK